MLIRLLELLGLAWNVKVPSRDKIALRLARQQAQTEPDAEPELERG
jgi:hypothetical protein